MGRERQDSELQLGAVGVWGLVEPELAPGYPHSSVSSYGGGEQKGFREILHLHFCVEILFCFVLGPYPALTPGVTQGLLSNKNISTDWVRPPQALCF